jgi:drug/metabolite transporter (DMT)-like permease
MDRNRTYPILLALLSASLFGASAPLAKLLLGDLAPVPLAALLYLGSGIALLTLKGYQRLRRRAVVREARLGRADLPWLAGAILAGGVTAPIILLFGLRSTPAATASLLLNFEAVATTLIAALAFKEAVGRRAWWAILIITLGSLLLGLQPNARWGLSLGAISVLVACMLWGLDNNLTRNISAKDPLAIVMTKGLVAGTISLILAIIIGSDPPDWKTVVGGLFLGGLSYGISLTLFVYAMRGLGAARTSALFATAPLTGVALSIVLLGESMNLTILLSMPLMILGAALLLYEEHRHTHVHEAITHEHAHSHNDAHHEHPHAEREWAAGPHSHTHEHDHEHLVHEHGHTPDTHHRHTHPRDD